MNFEENIRKALTTSQDVKIPDEQITIDKDLLQEIRDTLSESWDEDCSALVFKLDKIYPFLC